MKFTFRRQLGRPLLQTWAATALCTGLVYFQSFFTFPGHLVVLAITIGLLSCSAVAFFVVIAACSFWCVELQPKVLLFRSSPLRRPKVISRSDIREVRITDQGVELITQSQTIFLPRELENAEHLARRLNPVLAPPPKQIEPISAI